MPFHLSRSEGTKDAGEARDTVEPLMTRGDISRATALARGVRGLEPPGLRAVRAPAGLTDV